MIDLPLAAAQTAALLMLARALRGVPRALLWAGFFTSVSLAIKGPVGPAVIVLAAVGTLVALRRLELLRRGELWLGLALGLPICAPWYVWAVANHFHEFWAIHILDQHFARFDAPHGQNRWNLLLGALVYALPFTLLAACGLWRAVTNPESRRRSAVALAWLGAFAVIFGLPKEHGFHYPVLILPPLAALAAEALLRPTRLTPWLRQVTALVLGFAALGVLATGRFAPAPMAAAVVSAALLLLAAWLWGRTEALAAGFGTLAVACGTAIAIGWIGPALAGPLVPLEAVKLGAGRPIAVLGEHPGPYALAADWNQAYEVWGAEDLGRAIARHDLVLYRDHVMGPSTEALRPQLQRLWRWRRLRPYLEANGDLGGVADRRPRPAGRGQRAVSLEPLAHHQRRPVGDVHHAIRHAAEQHARGGVAAAAADDDQIRARLLRQLAHRLGRCAAGDLGRHRGLAERGHHRAKQRLGDLLLVRGDRPHAGAVHVGRDQARRDDVGERDARAER